jgi:hypothetical protein
MLVLIRGGITGNQVIIIGGILGLRLQPAAAGKRDLMALEGKRGSTTAVGKRASTLYMHEILTLEERPGGGLRPKLV